MKSAKNTPALFSPSGCLTPGALSDYVGERLTTEQTVSVEKHLADCPLCSDAVDGLTEFPKIAAHMEEKMKEAAVRFQATEKSTSDFGSPRRKNNRIILLGTVSAAASLLIFFISFIIINSIAPEHKSDLALENPESISERTETKEDAPESKKNPSDITTRSPAPLWGKSEEAEEFHFAEQEIMPREGYSYTVTPGYNNTQAPVVSDSIAVTAGGFADESGLKDNKDSGVDGILAKESKDYRESGKAEIMGKEKQAEKKPKRSDAPASADDDDMTDFFSQGMTHYNAGKFQQAIPLFEKALTKNPSDYASRYYEGMSWLAMKEYTKAINSFDKLLQKSGNSFWHLARWQKANALIAAGKNRQARQLLSEISSDGKDFSKEADELLKSLGQE